MKLVKPSVISGSVVAPASKSMMQRGIAAAILANGTSVLHNYTSCNDSESALRIANNFGCKVVVEGKTVTIEGGIKQVPSQLNCGEAGLGIRMFTPIAALCENAITMNGEGSLRTRPVSMLEAPLRQLGAEVSSNNGLLPITVKGPLKGGKAMVDGSMSSQMLTGMLFALPCAQNDSLLEVSDLKSKPYIDMTLNVMHAFGVEASHEEYKIFRIKGAQTYRPTDFNVEGDWSGAACLLVAGAIGGKVRVENIFTQSQQADKEILKAIEAVGAVVRCEENAVVVEKSELRPFEFDATECPDLFPPLVALASHCCGKSTIKGVGRLKFKESDRAAVLRNEFAKLGVQIDLVDDTMIVSGGRVSGGRVHANNDHRIAMATATAAIAAIGNVEIENPECIAKSYPDFFDDFAKIGGLVSEI